MTTACVIAAACILIAGLFAVIVERTNERDEAREERDRLERECNAHAAENARLTALTTPVPLLSIVPPQRDGGHDDFPVADIDVPVHTDIVDDDWLELLITRPVDGPTS